VLNLAVAALLTVLFRSIGWNSGVDSTDASAYVG
jgi:SSS family solute:Na+ symporter